MLMTNWWWKNRHRIGATTFLWRMCRFLSSTCEWKVGQVKSKFRIVHHQAVKDRDYMIQTQQRCCWKSKGWHHFWLRHPAVEEALKLLKFCMKKNIYNMNKTGCHKGFGQTALFLILLYKQMFHNLKANCSLSHDDAEEHQTCRSEFRFRSFLMKNHRGVDVFGQILKMIQQFTFMF